MQAVVQYMLDNNKWAFATCLNSLEDMTKPALDGKKPENPKAENEILKSCRKLIGKFIDQQNGAQPVLLFQVPFENK